MTDTTKRHTLCPTHGIQPLTVDADEYTERCLLCVLKELRRLVRRKEEEVSRGGPDWVWASYDWDNPSLPGSGEGQWEIYEEGCYYR